MAEGELELQSIAEVLKMVSEDDGQLHISSRSMYHLAATIAKTCKRREWYFNPETKLLLTIETHLSGTRHPLGRRHLKFTTMKLLWRCKNSSASSCILQLTAKMLGVEVMLAGSLGIALK